MKKLKAKDGTSLKIGAYIRVSTEEQASNPEGSIKSQEQRIRGAIDARNVEGSFGELVGVYVDSGLSGKDTNRPDLRRLLNDIASGQVTAVMVTELSRLSRSIRDFSSMWDLMREKDCKFLSLREQFDTTTASGEMVLFMLANIAQFERKQTSERISANFRARAERGLFNGGCLPFGYEFHPEKNGHLRIIEEEAKVVRRAFKIYLEEGSLAAAGKHLNELGAECSRRRKVEKIGGGKERIKFFTVGNLYQMLTNPVYVGTRVYKVSGEARSTRGAWEPIISRDEFDRVATLLKANYKQRVKVKVFKRYPFLLANRVVCGSCGQRMAGKSAYGNGGKISYYEHSWPARRDAYVKEGHKKCHPYRVPVKILEPLVWDEVTKILLEPSAVRSLLAEAHKSFEAEDSEKSLRRLQNNVAESERQLEALVDHVAKLPKHLSPERFFTKMEQIEGEKKHWLEELNQAKQASAWSDPPVSLKSYRAFVDGLKAFLKASESDAELRCRIVQRVVESIRVEADTFEVRYHVGERQIVALTPEVGADEEGNKENGGLALTAPAPSFLRTDGSCCLDNGGGSGRCPGIFFSTSLICR